MLMKYGNYTETVSIIHCLYARVAKWQELLPVWSSISQIDPTMEKYSFDKRTNCVHLTTFELISYLEVTMMLSGSIPQWKFVIGNGFRLNAYLKVFIVIIFYAVTMPRVTLYTYFVLITKVCEISNLNELGDWPRFSLLVFKTNTNIALYTQREYRNKLQITAMPIPYVSNRTKTSLEGQTLLFWLSWLSAKVIKAI